MDKKWSIMDKKDISDKCCQMENAIWNIFQSPSSWINGMNGFIRLVSMDGTWYHHRATDVFIPMTQNYINRFYRLDTRPERGAIRVRSGTVYWDYLNPEEALQILPNLPTSNLPNAQEAAGLGERCRNKKIFLKDGTVYDMDNKIIRPLQWNEEGSILQICHFEDKHKRNNAVLWHYDIYLWAKAGVIPSVLYASRECWNTMQFLVDNFNKIDFDDFLSLSGMDESAGGNLEDISSAVEPPVAATLPEVPKQAQQLVTPENDVKPKQSDSLEAEVAVKEVEVEQMNTKETTITEETAELIEEAVELEKVQETIAEDKEQETKTFAEDKEQEMETIAEDKEQETETLVEEKAAELQEEEVVKPENAQVAEPLQSEQWKPEEEAVKSNIAEKAAEVEQIKTKVAGKSTESQEEVAEPEQSQELETIIELQEEAVKPEKAQAIEMPKEEKVAELQEEAAELEKAQAIEIPKEEKAAELQEEAAELEKAQTTEMPEEEKAVELQEEAAESIQLEQLQTLEEPEKSTIAEYTVKTEQMKIEEAENVTELQEEVANSEKAQETEKVQEPETFVEENAVELQEEVVNSEDVQTTEPIQPEQFKNVEKIAKTEQPQSEKTIVQEKSVVLAEAEPEQSQELEMLVEEKAMELPEEAVEPKQSQTAETLTEEKATEAAEQFKTIETVAVLEKASELSIQFVESETTVEEKSSEPIEEMIQSIAAVQNVSATPEYPVELKQTTNQLEKTENMDNVQGEELTVTTDKIQELLDCDKNRCRLESYDKDILFDIIRGHWELYEGGAAEEARKNIKIESEEGAKEFIARNPKLDVKQGVVGIDFGTKSTVVVRQDATNRIVPIRIGTGNLSSEVKEEDFENPSIIEFTNVKKFLEDYQREVGRPHTSCNDIFVSYDAYEDFRNCKPDDFYAYFNELKQWANHEKGNVVIKDKQKKEYYLGENMGDLDDIVNPVELYAYYIGLHINNMRNGIYLKYLMTFPVGYAKEVRDFIADSFYKGIKKSLPTSIINDEECMAQFKVELGISEPAAYAVTALEQNHLEPKDETEQLMYGIFDFGGGTTDFDFGICRGATDEEYDKDAYDYVLECFGADSDVTLGGENILELMAYQVYQKNIDVFREKKITFTLPLGESGFAGSETLLIDSQIAKRNMAILKEELRPLWHQEQGWRKKYELENEAPNEADKEGVVVSLYNMDGEPVPQCMLEFSTQEMVEMIKNRIQKGIDSFFQCLIKIFLYKKEDAAEEEPTIYIFLSGNSSKSIFVKELFQKKIEEYYSKARKAGDEMGNAHFELFEPLVGTQDGSGYYVPNAKTGVAYGLLKSREGSSIKIIKNYETDAQQQSRFRYYLGRDRRHYFDCKFSPAEVSYKKWVSFQGASREVVRIYYTDNPVADSKLEQLSIENVPYKEITIKPMDDAYLFIRTVEPNLIEYAVAKEEDDITDSEIKNCYFI